MTVRLLLDKLVEWDRTGFYLINGTLRNWLFDLLMPLITDKWSFALPLSILFLYVLLFRPKRDRTLAISAVAVLLIADATAQSLKDLFHRIRPCLVLKEAVCSSSISGLLSLASKLTHGAFLQFQDLAQKWTGHELKVAVRSGSFSFPSNHASNLFAIATFLSYNYGRLVIPCFVAAALVGYSRIYVGSHYPTDVLAGAALGMLEGFSIAIAVARLSPGLGKAATNQGSARKRTVPVSDTKLSQ